LAHYAPAPLHTDTCSMVDVVLDVLGHYPGPPEQPVLLLQPTQPLRTPAHVAAALSILADHPSMLSVVEVEPAEKLLYMTGENRLRYVTETGLTARRRQECRVTYAPDGTVYGFRRNWFLEHIAFLRHDTVPLIIPQHETCRLDTTNDWTIAELLLRAATPEAPPGSQT
jgi:CMP-N-acetylneuraminic acid synthetase